MEGHIGAGLSAVNIHDDTGAHRLNRELGAQAFTVGRDIYFGAGKYAPETAAGKHLLAHELTHVKQQGAVPGSFLQKQEETEETPDHVDALRERPEEILRQLNPSRAGRYCQLNCPAAAQAVQDYLSTGHINPLNCDPLLEGNFVQGYELTAADFSAEFTWRRIRSRIWSSTRRHGQFIVIEGRRSAEQQEAGGLTEFHYFVIVNIRGTRFVVDAFGPGRITSDVDGYIGGLQTFRYRYVNGRFIVRPHRRRFGE